MVRVKGARRKGKAVASKTTLPESPSAKQKETVERPIQSIHLLALQPYDPKFETAQRKSEIGKGSSAPKDHEKAGIYTLLQERNLLTSVSMAKPFSRDPVREFYANLKKNVTNSHDAIYHKVFVRDYVFDFSLTLINDYWNLPVVESDRTRELDLNLDMTIVVNELTGFSVHEWPESNDVSSSVLTTKYSILHKIAIANWLPRLHLSTISK